METEICNIHGGIVSNVTVRSGGKCVIHGGVVERLVIQGNTKVEQHGGLVYYENEGDAAKPQPKIEYRDRVVYRDVVRYVKKDNPDTQQRLQELTARCEELKKKNEALLEELKGLDNNTLLADNIKMAKAMKRAKNRERVLIAQRDEAIARLNRSNPWDEFEPSAYAINKVYKTMCAFTEIDD
jgi:predicted RNase H-like nuclease (RuvC/YqgF family)